MKNRVIIVVLGFVVLSLSTVFAARPKQNLDSTEYAWRGHLKSSPHSVQINCATLMYHKEAYKIFNKMPALNFSATYMFDIPWWHKRTNFFVLAGLGYQGCRRDGEPYETADETAVYWKYVYDQYQIYLGMGLRIHLVESLDLSLSAAIDGSYNTERGRMMKGYTLDGYYFYIPRIKNSRWGLGTQAVFNMNLTYEIKNILISAGCQLYLGSDRKNGRYWKSSDYPHRSWATLGVGYRF